MEEDEDEVPMEEEQEDESNEREQQNEEDNAQSEREEQMETENKEYLEKCQRRIKSNLRKNAIIRTKKWVSRIDQTEIGQVIAKLDIQNVAQLMSMARADICFSETR
jgi:hypothetical protein